MDQGEKIKEMLRRKGISITEAAFSLKIKRGTLQTALGKAKLKDELLENIKNVLGIDISKYSEAQDTDKDAVIAELREKLQQAHEKIISLLEERTKSK